MPGTELEGGPSGSPEEATASELITPADRRPQVQPARRLIPIRA